jgi:D-glycero-alpha-D-manno-heptose-7-phosphate kinase
MLISKTPYRISFFGGGSDYPEWYLKNGGEVISASINKYIYISCRELPPFFDHKHRIVYSKIEQVQNLKDIKHPAFRECLNLFKQNFNPKLGLEIHYDGDLPAKSGMGSSSAFVVGLINLLSHFYLKKKLTKKNLLIQSLFLEQKLLKETVGSQDQSIAVYGGFNSIKFHSNGEIKVQTLIKDSKTLNDFSSCFFLVFTGIKRTASGIAKTYIKTLDNQNKSNIYEILDQVKLAKKLLQEKNFDDFGLLLNETWKIKKSLSKIVSTDQVDFIYQKGMSSGATGGKLLGAGGGGFFLFYVPREKNNFFLKKMKNFITTKFLFEPIGSEIIFKNK